LAFTGRRKMQIIRYSHKGFTNSNNEYITINEYDMPHLLNRATFILAYYADMSAAKEAKFVFTDKDPKYGRRGKKARYGAGCQNTVMSLLGGFIVNYHTKAEAYKYDISLNQIEYIETALNELADVFKFDTIKFQQELFTWKDAPEHVF
jgi:hypothetical protein